MATFQHTVQRLCPCGRGKTASLYHRWCARCIRSTPPQIKRHQSQTDDDDDKGTSVEKDGIRIPYTAHSCW